MTTLVSWIGVDSRAPSSLYIATDSRISWDRETWDFGLKTFASPTTADVFGYSGDVLFPSLLLAQFCAGLTGGIYDGDWATRFKALRQFAEHSLTQLAHDQRRPFEIVHCGRDGSGMQSCFRVGILSLTARSNFSVNVPGIPECSDIVHLGGSGAAEMERKWKLQLPGNTTRALFRSFVEALESGADPKSGGGPQMVGLYRVGAGKTFGIRYRQRRYLGGGPVHPQTPGEVDWRNEWFERIDGVKGGRLPEAQRHH
jgi:hypothetical protein